MKETYLIVKCELDEPWECEDDRTPLLILTTDNQDMLKPYQCHGYEIYIADSNGKLKRIQEYDKYPLPWQRYYCWERKDK